MTGGTLMDLVNDAMTRGDGPRAAFLLAVVYFALGAILLRPVVEPRSRRDEPVPVPA
jgi:hypothetical protein